VFGAPFLGRDVKLKREQHDYREDCQNRKSNRPTHL